MNTNAPKKTDTPEKAEDHRLSCLAVYAGTPGAFYVDTYLPAFHTVGDESWLAEEINRGEVIACPRCHFLSLPLRPFALDYHQIKNAEKGGYTLPACDVCAFLPDACHLQVVPQDLANELDTATAALENARQDRAETLLRLYMEQAEGAGALLWAQMAEARENVRRMGTLPAGE